MRNSRFTYLLVALTWASGAVAGTTDMPACLAKLCVGGIRMTERAVVKKLGSGNRVQRPDDGGASRCYFDAETGVWADFIFAGKEGASAEGTLSGIMLTEEKICDGRKGDPKHKLGRHLVGVAIGMDESEVLASRGEPTRIDDATKREANHQMMADTRYAAKFGERVFVYDKPDDLRFVFVYFKDGRVRTIWFADTE